MNEMDSLKSVTKEETHVVEFFTTRILLILHMYVKLYIYKVKGKDFTHTNLHIPTYIYTWIIYLTWIIYKLLEFYQLFELLFLIMRPTVSNGGLTTSYETVIPTKIPY